MPPDIIDFGKVSIKKLQDTDDISDFDCSLEDETECNQFIHNEDEAKLYQEERMGITYLFFYEDAVIGYVTLAMSSIPAKKMEGIFRKRISLKNYPSLLIGRLAVDNNWRKNGIGKYLCQWCIGFAEDMSDKVGCRYVILQTNKDKKVDFYEKCGFNRGKEMEDDQEKLVWMYQKIAI